MVYFDKLTEDHFGSIKQQLWSFLHFPLHLCLVLVLQGVSQFIVWRQAVESLSYLDYALSVDVDGNYTSAADFVSTLNNTAWGQVFDYVPKGVDVSDSIKEVNAALDNISLNYDNMTLEINEAVDAVYNDVYDIVFALSNGVLKSLSISAPDDAKDKLNGSKSDHGQQFVKLYSVFELLFTYFFITVSHTNFQTPMPKSQLSTSEHTLSVVALTKHSRTLSQYVRVAVNYAFGVDLCLLSLMKLNVNHEQNYSQSPWVLPTLCLVLFACVFANHLRFGAVGKKH